VSEEREESRTERTYLAILYWKRKGEGVSKHEMIFEKRNRTHLQLPTRTSSSSVKQSRNPSVKVRIGVPVRRRASVRVNGRKEGSWRSRRNDSEPVVSSVVGEEHSGVVGIFWMRKEEIRAISKVFKGRKRWKARERRVEAGKRDGNANEATYCPRLRQG